MPCIHSPPDPSLSYRSGSGLGECESVRVRIKLRFSDHLVRIKSAESLSVETGAQKNGRLE